MKFKSIAICSLNLFVGPFAPGYTLLAANRFNAAFGTPIVALLWVALLGSTRWISQIEGFLALIIGLLIIHFASYLAGLILQIKNRAHTSFPRLLSSTALLLFINLGITLTSHFYKEEIFGFGFYHIPSSSMMPTLIPGDILLVDSWDTENINKGDIVLFTQENNPDFVYIKRAVAVGPTNYDWENKLKQLKSAELIENQVFVVGDNLNHSNDSRHFGAINNNQIKAKASAIILSIKNDLALRNKRTLTELQ